MKYRGVFVILVVFLVAVEGRVFYLKNFEGNRYEGLRYPEEQSSRDLDLSFSAGDPNESDNSMMHPAKRMYTLVPPEKSFYELNKDDDWPGSYYKLAEAPIRRSGLDDIIVVPEKNRKLVKINGNNKGEVILELRVIANHDSN